MRGVWDDWATVWQTGLALAETLTASGEVLAARTALIGSALADPGKADWPELGRLVPEKVAAFGEAGAAAALDLARLHTDGLKLWMTMAGMAAAGRPPTVRQVGALLSQLAAGHGAAIVAGGRTLAPVHRRVVGNARRLRR